ncbi:MAG: hypothetical protein WAK60_00820 [Sedimentisphaerales bacterium]
MLLFPEVTAGGREQLNSGAGEKSIRAAGSDSKLVAGRFAGRWNKLYRKVTP